MSSPRTNAQWLRDLRSKGAEQTTALSDLRAYLLRVLPGCLKSRGHAPAELIEDIVQESLVRSLDQLERFEGRSRFTTWVTSIAVRVALTELRRRHWKHASLDELTAKGRLVPEVAVDPELSPETHAAQRGILQALRNALEGNLSERQRVAIVAELQGLPQEEIGRHLGISRNAVYKLGHDARKKLKQGLEASGFNAGEVRAVFQ